MKQQYNEDDTFLGRWAAGTLPEEERIAFEKTELYAELKKIDETAQQLEGPNIDTEAALIAVKEKLQKTKKHVRQVKVIKIWYRIAAVLLILVSLITFLNSSKTYTTEVGEKRTILLADGSEVHLNANSSLTHKRFFWKNDRTVHIKGEGFFTVISGNSFTVMTSKGNVGVLGTKFNILDRSEFEVKCYEGKVQFIPANLASPPTLLTKGMSLRNEKNGIEKSTFKVNEFSNWRNGTSSFIDKPISLVLGELMNHYPIQFEFNNVVKDRLYTGSFTHSDLNKALKTTLIPMGITYKLTPSGTVILSQTID